MDVKPEVTITFEDEPAVFHVGKESIKGDVRISITKLMKTQMIKVEFKGACQVSWNKRGVSDRLHKSIEHFSIEDKLLTPRSAYNDLFLRSGVHCFPFVFELPQAMPPTFIAADGKIEYFAKVIVHYRDDGSMVSNEVCAEAPLTMKKSIANFPQKLLQSVKLKEQLTLSKFFSRSTIIDVEAKIPKRVYHRGEIIRLTCDYKIVNGSVGNVNSTYAVLMQGVSVVKSSGHEIMKQREIVRAPPFHGAGESSQWSDTYMTIPDDISLTVQGCGGIMVFYFIQIRAKNSKEKIDIPVVIIDRDETKIVNSEVGSKRARRLSLTGGLAAPSIFQTFNALNRQDPVRASKTSIDSYYGD